MTVEEKIEFLTIENKRIIEAVHIITKQMYEMMTAIEELKVQRKCDCK